MDTHEISYAVASKWMDILMKSSTADDVEKFFELSRYTPTEISLVMLVANTQDLLLRDFLAILKIPKSTLTSIINRLEKKGLIERVINSRDKRSFSLKLTERGAEFANLYIEYQCSMGDKILKGLADTEQVQLLQLLDKIATSICPSNY